MKALGLRNNSVRGLYLVKYLGIAVIGAVIGFVLSIPFGNALMQSVSENMVLESDNALILNIICSLAVVAVILLFCWSCTRKIKKLSPIDAVRSGQTGERFKKKGFLHLEKSKLGTTGFLAVNDVFSSPKQFGIMTVIFSVCLLLIMGLANTANTLASEKLLPKMCATKSDAYITDTEMISRLISGETSYSELSSEIEQKLAENGLPGKVHSEAIVFPLIEANGNKATSAFMYCADTKASDYEYTEGYAPKYANEIALTKILADNLGVGVGDKVNITLDGRTGEYMVSALFNSLVQLGETGRFHESADIPEKLISNVMGFQIDFDDHPDANESEKRIEKMKDIFDSKYVDNADGFVAACIGGNIKDTISGIKIMVLVITAIIIIMISVLIERSLISKEKSEIALMKAMGFKTGSVIAQHTLRFVVVAITASVIAAALCLPVTKLCIDPIFRIIGALNGVDYNIRPIEIYAVYPLVVITATITGAFLTSLYMKKIKASDTSDIE
jgi:putative ABC transport system permease protein